MVKALIVMLAVPFSAIGAVWLLYALGYHVSIAVWVGIIALPGLDAETGVFMLLFLDLAHYERIREGKMKTFAVDVEAMDPSRSRGAGGRPMEDSPTQRTGSPAPTVGAPSGGMNRLR